MAEATGSKTEAVLEVRNLKVHFPIRRGVFSRLSGCVRAVDDVSFELRRGETLALVGESGSGKSTVARAILALVRPTAGAVYSDGCAVAELAGQALLAYRRKVQAVFQDPLASLNPRHTVCEAVTGALALHARLNAGEREAEARRLLADVGLEPELLARYPHELSGGQRQRVSIARALSLKPQVLVCDEATSALDLSVRAQVLDLLGELRRRHSLSLLFITHDLGVARHVADRVAVMRAGKLVESGDAAAVFGSPATDYTRALLAAVPRLPGSAGPVAARERVRASGDRTT